MCRAAPFRTDFLFQSAHFLGCECQVPGNVAGGGSPKQFALAVITEQRAGINVVACVGYKDVAVLGIHGNAVWRNQPAVRAVSNEFFRDYAFLLYVIYGKRTFVSSGCVTVLITHYVKRIACQAG